MRQLPVRRRLWLLLVLGTLPLLLSDFDHAIERVAVRAIWNEDGLSAAMIRPETLFVIGATLGICAMANSVMLVTPHCRPSVGMGLLRKEPRSLPRRGSGFVSIYNFSLSNNKKEKADA
jgi:hypothetical protein